MRSDAGRYEVIINCSVNDRDVADIICAALEANGISCWYSHWQNLKTLRMHRELAQGALEHCTAMVLVLSANVRLEEYVELLTHDALREGKPLVSFEIDHTDARGLYHSYPSWVKIINATEQPMEPRVNVLIAAVNEVLGGVDRSIDAEAYELYLMWKSQGPLGTGQVAGERSVAKGRMSAEDCGIIGNRDSLELHERLLSEYQGFIIRKAESMLLRQGHDLTFDELIKEGMIGLHKAIRDYDYSKEASFKCFADLCITRQLLIAVKVNRRFYE